MGDGQPATLGRYELVDKLAVGGMAELYKARVRGAHGFEKPLVIKRILPHLASDPQFVEMFIDEAKITARLTHPKIVQVHDFEQDGDQLYIAMEFVEGTDVLRLVRKCMAAKTPLPAALAIHVAMEVLDALDYAHGVKATSGEDLGIVHRDISPGNVMVSKDGHVKLADFGIARAAERSYKTQTGTLKGKYGYMSPEQIIGKPIDGRSDLFSVAVVLAELLMFRRLFTAPNDLDVLLMVRDVNLKRLDQYGKHIAPDLRAIVDHGLQRGADQRFQSAAEFRDALGDYLFAINKRVGRRQLGEFLADLDRSESEKARAKAAQASQIADAPDEANYPSVGTMSGPRTKASKLAAEQRARVGRQLFQTHGESFQGTRSTGGGDRPGSARPVRPSTEAPGRAPSPVMDLDDPDTPIGAHTGELSGEFEIVEGDAVSASGPSIAIDPHIDPRLDSHSDAPPRGQSAPVRPAEPGLGRPDSSGSFERASPFRVLHNIVAYRLDGLLVVQRGDIVKEAFFSQGHPQFVRSNQPTERLGEYLVRKGVLSAEQLQRALSLMPHFGGRLGDTLVGLQLMRPLDAVRHLSQQVREKLIDVCTWSSGDHRWYANRANPWPTLPLHLDSWDVLGGGARALDADLLSVWARRNEARTVVPGPTTMRLELLGLGARMNQVADRLTARVSLRQLITTFAGRQRADAARCLYLLNELDVAQLA